MLCKVTANTSMVVFFNFDFTPSGFSLSKCICGITLSSTSKNIIPNKNPIAGAIHPIFPCCSDISIAGINNDHIDAAIITPDAKPNSNFSIDCFILFLKNITIAEPNAVPANGISNPYTTSIFYFLLIFATKNPS